MSSFGVVNITNNHLFVYFIGLPYLCLTVTVVISQNITGSFALKLVHCGYNTLIS